MKRDLGTRDLSSLAIASIIGTRWIASAARAGSGALLIWFLAAAFLAVPLAIAVARLAVRDPSAGGMYAWARSSYGPWHGFLCFFLYWTGIVIWFPGAAMFYVSMALPSLATNRTALVAISLAAVWVALGFNILGVKFGKWTNHAGTLASVVLFLVLAVLAFRAWQHRGSATPLQLLPSLDWNSVSFWATIAWAMSGMEVLGSMGAEIRDPARTIPRAAIAASVVTTIFYAGSTLAMLILLRPENIGELTGLSQAAATTGSRLFTIGFSVLVLLSAVGQFSGLGAAASRLPFAAGVDNLLPPAFARLHPRWGTPYVAILAMGLIATVVLVGMQLGDTALAAYQALVSLMVITGFLPYVYVFGCAWKLGVRWSSISGWAVTAIALASSMVPSSDVTNVWGFEAKLLLGTVGTVGAAWLLFRDAQIRYHVEDR